MSRREILITDTLLDKNDLDYICKQILDHPYEIDGLALPVEYLHLMYDYFDCIDVIPQIDLFSGLSRHKEQDVFYASSFKIQHIDVKINEFLLVNDKIEMVFDEIKTLQQIAKDKKKKLRIIFDYRMIEAQLDELIGLIRFSGIDTVITSVGTRVNDAIDEAIIADKIHTSFGLNVLCTLTVNREDHYSILKETESIYGIRFTSLSFIKSLLSEKNKPTKK